MLVVTAQLRSAILLARRLDRLLVLPELVCGLDRFWAPHNGTIPGSDTILPIDPCPADHVINLEGIARKQPGDTIENLFRESSFLRNPRLPAHIRDSRAQLPPPEALTDEALASLRSAPHASTRVLHFTHMGDLFPTLPAKEREELMQTMRDWTDHWCCSQPPKKGAAGHVWYDLFWDVIPHTNRMGSGVVTTPWTHALFPNGDPVP